MAAASGDSNSLISSGASWRDKLQIPKPIANATAAIRTVVTDALYPCDWNPENSTVL